MKGPTIRQDDDRALAELFRAQRERDHARAPSFERVVVGRSSPPPARRWMPAVLAAAMVVLAVGLWLGRGSGSARASAFHIEAGQLRTPTDFLLDLAGPGLAGAVPRFGRSEDWLALPGPDDLEWQPEDEGVRL